MKRLFHAGAILLTFVSVAYASEPAQLENIEEWMTYYYLAPKPDEVASALSTISTKGYFENDNVQGPLSGFFTEVFVAHPERIKAWVEPYVGISGRHILYSALWSAHSKQSKAALERMAKKAEPKEAERLMSLLNSTPPTVESMSIATPAALDYLWGRFMASGSEAPVARIIDQMHLVRSEGNVGAILIGGAAQWSVAANARQHKKVLEIVKAKAVTADAETKPLLDEILAGIEAEKGNKAR